eukprot:Rhum_TRINITY_DN15428_c17_g5::Rhum_TRINITY_DN15428_c17_g5_i1::g.155935::m.155935
MAHCPFLFHSFFLHLTFFFFFFFFCTIFDLLPVDAHHVLEHRNEKVEQSTATTKVDALEHETLPETSDARSNADVLCHVNRHGDARHNVRGTEAVLRDARRRRVDPLGHLGLLHVRPDDVARGVDGGTDGSGDKAAEDCGDAAHGGALAEDRRHARLRLPRDVVDGREVDRRPRRLPVLQTGVPAVQTLPPLLLHDPLHHVRRGVVEAVLGVKLQRNLRRLEGGARPHLRRRRRHRRESLGERVALARLQAPDGPVQHGEEEELRHTAPRALHQLGHHALARQTLDAVRLDEVLQQHDRVGLTATGGRHLQGAHDVGRVHDEGNRSGTGGDRGQRRPRRLRLGHCSFFLWFFCGCSPLLGTFDVNEVQIL